MIIYRKSRTAIKPLADFIIGLLLSLLCTHKNYPIKRQHCIRTNIVVWGNLKYCFHHLSVCLSSFKFSCNGPHSFNFIILENSTRIFPETTDRHRPSINDVTPLWAFISRFTAKWWKNKLSFFSANKKPWTCEMHCLAISVFPLNQRIIKSNLRIPFWYWAIIVTIIDLFKYNNWTLGCTGKM